MASSVNRNGSDKLQKVFLYLILLNLLLLTVVSININTLRFSHGVIVLIMMFIYNYFLVHLCYIRAARSQDAYLIYPVVIGALSSFFLVVYFFFLH
ncbi:hypothetical protein C9I43_14340 [Shewanella morhuae]|uniref:Uncharacterized protein n=2 Tax=Shewanella TaxID=22 RepID=A0A1N6X2W1_9GAMM|nr:hypothetical protein C9I43_14340 [Shewanella morhuae]GIU04226.1 hypothetical protein TUM4636_02500 [Shewanella glacialipiscicola]SIQ96600.1 hypothetical protein SAMN05421840_106185 [Shewanella morhuae]SUI91908.1 Uncharacterised protein [Shewanella morhuae]GMA80509.1 hypothetical protein GCM10025855_00420 [Shewanella glacialipiscicola]